MVANTSPVFVLTPSVTHVVVETANANLDGTGTLATLKTGATNGTYVEDVRVKGVISNQEGMHRLFLDDGAGNIYLLDELNAPIQSGTAVKRSLHIVFHCGFILPSGWILKMGTEFGYGAPNFSNKFRATVKAFDL